MTGCLFLHSRLFTFVHSRPSDCVNSMCPYTISPTTHKVFCVCMCYTVETSHLLPFGLHRATWAMAKIHDFFLHNKPHTVSHDPSEFTITSSFPICAGAVCRLRMCPIGGTEVCLHLLDHYHPNTLLVRRSACCDPTGFEVTSAFILWLKLTTSK